MTEPMSARADNAVDLSRTAVFIARYCLFGDEAPFSCLPVRRWLKLRRAILSGERHTADPVVPRAHALRVPREKLWDHSAAGN